VNWITTKILTAAVSHTSHFSKKSSKFVQNVLSYPADKKTYQWKYNHRYVGCNKTESSLLANSSDKNDSSVWNYTTRKL